MHSSSKASCLAAVLAVSAAACTDAPPTALEPEAAASLSLSPAAPPPPPGLVQVGALELWPYTGRDLDGTIADPVNLLFEGDVDVVSLRAALLSLDGDRTAVGFPASAPFDCTWKDAHGGMQSAYTSGAGWVANAVQLECGDYAPLRFHIRLFDAGDAVVAAVHFDLLIPGTPLHQVIGWELPQQLIAADFARSGLLAAPPALEAVSAAGPVQAIPKPIYDGIPDALKVAVGFPPGPTAQPEVPIPSDGLATVLTLGARAPVSRDEISYEVAVPFDQVIPRPFCSSGPTDVVLVRGTVNLGVRTRVTASGHLTTHNTLRGDLEVVPIDVTTGQPGGAPFRASISALDVTGAGPQGTFVDALVLQRALPPGDGSLMSHLVTGPGGSARFSSSETCG